jgi:1-aminocyclopropane-1-carboxylate deaminase
MRPPPTRGPELAPTLLLPTPRVIAVRGKHPSVFQLLDYEVSPNIRGISGIHARKLAHLCGYESASALCENDVPALPAREAQWTPQSVQMGLVSCGGMLARGGCSLLPPLARLCAARGSTLTFHTPPLPDWLRDEPTGHLAEAIATGALRLVEHATIDEYNKARAAAEGQPNFVPQGGPRSEAEPAIAALARTIGAWWRTRPGGGLDLPRWLPKPTRGLDVVIPAGTGTTALFLARHVPPGVCVYAVPCKGGPDELLNRMRRLDESSGAVGRLPSILLPPPPARSKRFGSVSMALLEAWRDASFSGVLLDLIYGATAWTALEACGWRPSSGESGTRDVLFVNTGGHDGLQSQMRRYSRAGLLRKWEQGQSLLGRRTVWYDGQWGVDEVIAVGRRTAAATAGLVHTRDAGL